MLKSNTKARMLDFLKDKLQYFAIPELVYFTVRSWSIEKKKFWN